MTALLRRTAGGVALLIATLGVGRSAPVRHPAGPGETSLYDVGNVRVLHRVSEGSEVVAVRLYLLGGTRQLTAKMAGIEALLLRTLWRERGGALWRTGARSIVEIGADWSVVGFIGLRKDVDSAWAGFAELLAGPPTSPGVVGEVRDELLTEARRRHTAPDLRVRAMAREAAFAGHPYEIDPHGTEESLAALTPADLERYWEEQIVTSRMLLVVVGDVSRAQVEVLVARALGGLPTGGYAWTLPPPIESRPSGWQVEQRALPTNYLLGYVVGPDPRDRDYFPFRAAVALLSSQLAREVRGRRSLSYSAYAPFFDHALPAGGLYASTSHPAEVLETMREELEDLAETRYLDQVWRSFLDQFTLDRLLEQMTSDGQAEALARAQLYFDDLEMADGYVDRLRHVSLSDVRRVAERYFGNIQYAFLGDTAQMRGAWEEGW